MMKYILVLAATLFAQLSFGQNIVETRTAELMSGDYFTEGTVHLELYDDNTLNLRFDSNYQTQSNVFDVHVYLTNDNDYTAPIDVSDLLLVENIGTISGLNYSSGPMTFTLSDDVGINDYQYIVFVCVQFGRLHWADGVFEESVVITSTEELADEAVDVSIYPNPSIHGVVEIQFEEPQQNVVIDVLNVNGQLVSREELYFTERQHSLELASTGIYFVRITTDQGSTTQKVVRL